MNNPYNNLPSYVKEAEKFSCFLGSINNYLGLAAEEVFKLKGSFLEETKSSFVVQSLASKLGVTVDVPFSGGEPDFATYYKKLLLAYRARLFVSMFGGNMVGLLTGDLIGDKASMVVLDFSVARADNRTSMAVVYSVLSVDQDLNLDIVRDYLIPKITGVNASLYFLQFGQDVFGYDIDEKEGIKIGPDHVNTVPIEELNRFKVVGATINNLGSGYEVGDVVTTLLGVQLRITELLSGSALAIENVSQSYNSDPAGTELSVTGGSGSDMTVDVQSGSGSTYFIRGFDNGSFISISRRAT